MQPKGFLVGIGVGGHFSWGLISGCQFLFGGIFPEGGDFFSGFFSRGHISRDIFSKRHISGDFLPGTFFSRTCFRGAFFLIPFTQ